MCLNIKYWIRSQPRRRFGQFWVRIRWDMQVPRPQYQQDQGEPIMLYPEFSRQGQCMTVARPRVRITYCLLHTHPAHPSRATRSWTKLLYTIFKDIYPYLVAYGTYDHRVWRTGLHVRSAVLKPHAGRLVVWWVTTFDSLLLYVLF